MQYPDGPMIVPKQSMVPWILFAFVLVAGLGAILVEQQKLDAAVMRVSTTAKAEVKARAELAEAASAKRALELRVQELQTENGRLTVKVAAAAQVAPLADKAHARKKARSKHHRHH